MPGGRYKVPGPSHTHANGPEVHFVFLLSWSEMAASGNAQTDGHRALLEIESRFNAKSRGVVLGIQGSQLLALAMFADLFERFPYPVMINAALLKLADWFRTSNNAVKFHIYKVLKNASDEHLARVINIEEMVRRVTPVLSSNDLLARALTLRVLGCISMIIADNMEVHHAVLERLADATERVEMEAAIWATDRLCACSTQFPSIVFPQIISKLNDPSISFDSKLRLVKVFRHMHRDMRMADKAKAACLELLGTADLGENLVNTILRTMTLLLSEGLIMSQTSTDRTDQVDRLINYLIHDNREKVRMSALDDLILLARKDMSFDRNQIMSVLRFLTQESENHALLRKGFVCVQRLLRTHQSLISHALANNDFQTCFIQTLSRCEAVLLESIEREAYTTMIICTRFLNEAVSLASLKQGMDPMDIDNDALGDTLRETGARLIRRLHSAEMLNIVQAKRTTHFFHQTREIFRLLARLVSLVQKPDETNNLFREAFDIMTRVPDHGGQLLLAYLSSIAPHCRNLDEWFPEKGFTRLQDTKQSVATFVNTAILLLRTVAPTDEIQRRFVDTIRPFGAWNEMEEAFETNGWQLYVIAREAGAYRWNWMMYTVLQDLVKMAESPASHTWMKSLSAFGLAELTLTTGQPLNEARQHYIASLTYLESFQALAGTRQLQAWFLQLRMESISALYQLTSILKSCPPSQWSRMLPLCADSFMQLVHRYEFLRQSVCGSDEKMADLLHDYKLCMSSFEYATRTCAEPTKGYYGTHPSLDTLIYPWQEPTGFKKLCSTFIKCVLAWQQGSEPEEYKRAGAIRNFCDTFLRYPFVLPMCFFKNKKIMTVQLTTDPPLSDHAPVALARGRDLVIKFEGVVQMPYRLSSALEKAIITCFVTKEKITHMDDRLGISMLFADPPADLLIQPPIVYSASIKNAYFTCYGLISLPARDHEVWLNVSVRVVDVDQSLWACGPYQCGRITM